jgi:glycosyltransferase involved in cell wall biosynthesis
VATSAGETHFSLVILCYRGGQAVVPFVRETHALLSAYRSPRRSRLAFELILVGNYDPGAADPTPDVVRHLAAELPFVHALTLPKQGMMGWDMKSGLSCASGEFVGVVDGDGQFPPTSVVDCLRGLEEGTVDFIKTYRVQRDDGALRRVISTIYNVLFRMLFGGSFRDANSKPKIIRRSRLTELVLRSDDWFIDAEMMIQAMDKGLRMAEVPVHFHALTVRPSFVRFRAIREFTYNLIRYWLVRRGWLTPSRTAMDLPDKTNVAPR